MEEPKEIRIRCLSCKKELVRLEDEKRVRPNKKFCSDKCREKYNAKKSYLKYKDIPEYKSYLKDKYDRWRKNNPERFCELVKKSQLKKKMRELKEMESFISISQTI